MSSSSSDDDDTIKSRLKEAAAEELVSHMKVKKNKEPQTRKNAAHEQLRSQRSDKQSSEESQYDLKSTPEFKLHVAKKLESYLDRILEMSNATSSHNGEIHAENGGIHLLSSSVSKLPDQEQRNIPTATTKPPRKRFRNRRSSSEKSSDDEDERKRISLVCVSGESILKGGEGAFIKPHDKELK